MPTNPLEAVHRTLGAFLVERAGTPMPARYGEVREEHLMVRRTAGVFDLFSAGKIAVQGPERLRFLQGVLAADLSGIVSGSGAYSLLLARDGRIAGEMRLLACGDEILLFTPSIARAKVKRLLERHLAASEATIVDESESLALLSVQGRAAPAVIEAALDAPAPLLVPFAGRAVRSRALGDVLLVGARRGGETGYDVVVPVGTVAPLFERLVEAARAAGGGVAGIEALDSLRVEVGLPAYGADMDETTLPTELDVVGRGVSMEKGCFLGRDALAKLIAEGEPARRLVGVLFEGSYPPVRGDRLYRAGQAVGSVTSATYSPMLARPVALAMLATEASARGTQLTTADDGPALVTRIPFWDQVESTGAATA